VAAEAEAVEDLVAVAAEVSAAEVEGGEAEVGETSG
jgi:hypothetical protein